MASGKRKASSNPSAIALNRRARHEYFVEDVLEAGLALHGWEVKALRDGRAQIAESYVVVRGSEVWLVGAHITPLTSASTHVNPDPTRARKLLLHRREIDQLIGATERKGYTAVPLKLYWSRGNAKLQIGVAKGKKQHDKRATERERDWRREQARVLKAGG